MKRLLVVVVVILVLLQSHLLFGQISYPDTAVIQDLFNRFNSLRTRRGLPAVSMNAALTAAAQDQAQWLVETRMRTHVRPDGSRPSTRALAAGYVTTDWCCGENYYMSIDATPDMVWNFWTWSASHYANLVHPRFDEVGFGMYSDGYRHSYVMVMGNAPDPLAPPTPVPAVDTVAQGSYVVQRGDTLLRIARRFGTSVDALAAANGLVNPSLIYPGQQLAIPGAAGAIPVPSQPQIQPSPIPIVQQPSAPVSAPAAGTHVVQPGENLFRIALRYGLTMQAIMATNGMTDPNRVFVGQRLVIPSGGTAGSITTQTTSSAAPGQCGGFAPTSPLDGYHNGATTFYWNPAPGSIGGYRVEIFNASGQLVATFDAPGSNTSVTGDMSASRIGNGLTFSWDVVALVNGQTVCTTQRITAPRENSAP